MAANEAIGDCKMTVRAKLAGAASLVAMLATAGGGAAAATVKHGYPFAPGDSFTYNFNSTVSVKPSCKGTPVVTTTSYPETTTIMPAITYSYPPGNSATVYPFVTTATTTTANGALTVTNTDYRNFVTNGSSTDLVDYGLDYISTLQEPNNVTQHQETTRKYLAPLLRDQEPRQAKKILPFPVSFNDIENNYYLAPTMTNILQSNATRNVDGSYTESGTTYDTPFSIQQNSDSTGQGIEGPSNAPETWTFLLPQVTSKGDVIPVQATYGGASGTTYVPDWFPGHAAPRNPLAKSSYVDKGGKKVPAGCGIYAGKTAALLQMTYSNLAPVAGYLYSETDAYYVVNGVGRVCMEVTHSQETYDQEVSGKCLSAQTFHSTEGLVSESIH
jgi:hypothetical protein